MKHGLFFLVVCLMSGGTVFSQTLQLGNPKLFVKLDSMCRTPDAIAIDGAGNIYLSVTNATTFDQFGARIIKLSPRGVVVNFDTYTTNANKTIDDCNTLSFFDIRR